MTRLCSDRCVCKTPINFTNNPKETTMPRKPRPSEYRARLLKLAKYLDTVPDEQFDYDLWAYEAPCGTVGCALGHAVLGPFKNFGYTLKKPAAASTIIRADRVHPGVLKSHPVLRFYKGECYSDASSVIRAIFGEDNDDVFYPTGPREATATAKQVADKIRRHVAKQAEDRGQ